MKEMLAYSLPLVPNSLSWWVVQISDRYMVTWFINASANGVYSMAYKVPSMIGVIADIFIQAWILSAMDEYDGEKNYNAFTNIYKSYETVLILCSAGLICFNRLIGQILFGNEFFDAVLYSPLLVFALLFNNLEAFFSAFYNATKKTKDLLFSSITAAVINIVINLIFIPLLGVYGAVLGTCVSYLVLLVMRIVGSGRLVKFKINYIFTTVNISLLLIQAISETFMTSSYVRTLLNIGITVFLIIINLKRIKMLIEMFIGLVKQGKKRVLREV